MAGLEFSIVDVGGRQVKRRLDRLSHIDTTDLLESVGAVVESQTRRRIKFDKESPEFTHASSRSGASSTSWEPLSPKYARRKKRISSGGILELHGGLLDSIQFEVRGDGLIVGSNLVYSWTHQVGDKREAPSWSGAGRSGGKVASSTHTVEIPARPYLGLSDENRDEVEDVVIEFLKERTGFSR